MTPKTEEIRSSIDEFIWPNKWLLTFTGFWPIYPTARLAVRYFSHCRAVLVIVLTNAVVLPQIAEIVCEWGDIRTLTEVGSILMPMLLAVFKQLYLVARRAEFERTYWLIRDLWRTKEDFNDSNKSLESCAWQAMFATLLFYAAGCSTLALYIAAPIYVWKGNERRANGTDYQRHLLLNSRYWFDPSPSPIFEMIYALQSLGFYAIGNSVVGIDGSMLMMIMQVVGQFKIISRRLERVGRALASTPRKMDPWIVILQCVRHHARMLRIVNEINSLLGPMILAQILLAGLEICLSGYAVMSSESSGLDAIKYICVFATAIVQLVIYCWPGEMLIQESTALATTVCHDIPWFALPREQQRDLCLVIVRSQRQGQITALGLQIMTMRKLTEVLQAAGSYMALLRSVRDKQQHHPGM